MKIASLTLVALLFFSFSLAQTAMAQAPAAKSTTAATGSQIKKAHYGKGMRARGGAGCKMSGSC